MLSPLFKQMVIPLFVAPAAALGLFLAAGTISHCGEVHRYRREYRAYLPPEGEALHDGMDTCPVHTECIAMQYFAKVKVP